MLCIFLCLSPFFPIRRFLALSHDQIFCCFEKKNCWLFLPQARCWILIDSLIFEGGQVWMVIWKLLEVLLMASNHQLSIQYLQIIFQKCSACSKIDVAICKQLLICKHFNCKNLLNANSLDIIWFSVTTPELLSSLTLNKFTVTSSLARNLSFNFLYSWFVILFYKSMNVTFQKLSGSSENTHKSNVQQFFFQSWNL